jgi:hypothetical protein
MNDLQQEISTKLSIYSKGYQEYIKCLIRGIEIPINGRPEEMVRQIFLYFLIKESRLFPDTISIVVEVNNHDIEIYERQVNENFKPHQSPLIIVEVKREDVNLYNYFNQLKRYLKKSSSDFGILYNYHEILCFTKINHELRINHINTLKDVEDIILNNCSNVNDDLSIFEKAQNGNFDSFKYLLNKYGEYKNKILFKLKQYKPEIKGHLFRVQGDTVYYDVCGQYSDKQESFNFQDFEKLISITY